MRTLPQLIARSHSMRKLNARYVKMQNLKAGHDAHGLGFVAAKTYSDRAVDANGFIRRVSDPSKYVTVITFLDKKLHCKVSCSCPDFMFMYEVALHEKNAADIEYSNGEQPDMKNPKKVPGVCKHLIALYNRIESKLPKS